MATQKMVDGRLVALSAGEVAEFDARNAAWAAAAPIRQAARDRFEGVRTDPEVLALVAKLNTMTAAQIDDYFSANVQTPAQTIAILKTLIKLLAFKFGS